MSLHNQRYHPPEIPVNSRRCSSPLLWALVVVLLGCATEARGETEDMSGPWDASPLIVNWAIGTWGPHCGDEPSGGSEPGARVTLESHGADFDIRGLSRPLSTTSCFEPLPGLVVRSHSTSAVSIRTTCEMPSKDPRQASLTTTWALRGDKIYFDEAAQYRFLVADGACTASARRTRVFTRVIASPPSLPEQLTAPELLPQGSGIMSPAEDQACTAEAKATTLELRSSALVIKSGESVRFDIRARGPQGCRLERDAVLRFHPVESGLARTKGNEYRVDDDASSGKVTAIVSIDGLERRLELTVLSREEIDRLLVTESKSPSLAQRSPLSSSGESVVEERFEGPFGLWFLGGGLVCLGFLGAIAVLRRLRATVDMPVLSVGLPQSQYARPRLSHPNPEGLSTAPPRTPEDGASPERVCPACGLRYPANIVFCGEDGTKLLRAN